MGAPHWYRPAAHLRDWVSTFCGYRTAAGPRGAHQGVASGHLTVVLCLDGRLEMLANADPAKPPGVFTAMASGLYAAPARIATGEASEGLQIDLTWRGARALLGVPASELAGDTVDLAALLGRRTGTLLDRLAAAADWPTRFALLEAEFTALGARHTGRAADRIPAEVGYAWDRLAETGGGLRVADLAVEIGWSRRHLGEQFRIETGLAPKAAARVIRFERACRMLRGPAPPPLADVAHAVGYVDQAHLSRDFRDLAGQTATSWLAERRADAPPPAAATAGSPARRA